MNNTDTPVLTIQVFRDEQRFLARVEARSPHDEDRQWHPMELFSGNTAIAAANEAVAEVTRIGEHSKRGRKPNGYDVARWLVSSLTP